MTLDRDLESKVGEFAAEITTTVKAVLGDEDVALRAVVLDQMVVVSTEGTGIRLLSNGSALLDLHAKFFCGWDSSGGFIAVHRSEFHVLVVGDREPILRFEYENAAGQGVPTAHMHVHAHRDAATWAMSNVGSRSARARRRQKDSGIPKMKDLHFPLGGKRFRPSLEDVLQLLVEEFGIDAADTWRQGLAEGRASWRRTQTRAAVRDAPEDAAAILQELGYTVVSPPTPPSESASLRQY